jgi:hypothetical protein
MARLACVVLCCAAAGCSRATSPAAQTTETSHAMSPTQTPAMSVAFCGFGGQGVLGPGMRWEDFIRVIVVVDVTVPGTDFVRDVTLSSIAMVNDEGVVEASMRAPISVERVEPMPATTTWENATRPGALPFDGVLWPGRTRLRVEAWLTAHPRSYPLRVRVVIASPAGPLEADGAVNGEWPTG